MKLSTMSLDTVSSSWRFPMQIILREAMQTQLLLQDANALTQSPNFLSIPTKASGQASWWFGNGHTYVLHVLSRKVPVNVSQQWGPRFLHFPIGPFHLSLSSVPTPTIKKGRKLMFWREKVLSRVVIKHYI